MFIFYFPVKNVFIGGESKTLQNICMSFVFINKLFFYFVHFSSEFFAKKRTSSRIFISEIF